MNLTEIKTILKQRTISYFLPALVAIILFYFIVFKILFSSDIAYLSNQYVEHLFRLVTLTVIPIPFTIIVYFIFVILVSYLLARVEDKYVKTNIKWKLFLFRVLAYFVLVPVYLLVSAPITYLAYELYFKDLIRSYIDSTISLG